MAKLICLQGLPASGKSTKAAELLKEYGNAVRINRDLLRECLHNDVWSGPKEGITRGVARSMVLHLLQHSGVGVVIIDDTNLNPRVLNDWQEVARACAAQFEVMRLDTDVEECIIRDAFRKKSVGRSVIIGMALQHGLYPQPPEGVVLCDIDGTLADCTHRLMYLDETPRDWASFFNAMDQDTPRKDIGDLAYAESWGKGRQLFLVSGRPDDYRGMTEAWLHRHFPLLAYRALFMRRAGDHRPDTVVKEEMLTRYFYDPSWIQLVIDDRPSVLRMWERYGLPVIDVGTGIEF